MKLALYIGLAAALIFFIFSIFSNDSVSQVVPRDIKPESGVKIIAFGDSLTAGYGLPVSEAYPAQLEKSLKDKGLTVTVINSGVSGETTRGNLERTDFIRKQNPDLVLLGIGGNDALRALPVEETRKNMYETINILKGGVNPPEVVLLQMQAPINAGLAYKKYFDSIYSDLAKEKGILLLPFITAELFLNRDYKLSDGLHYNKEGYGQVVDLYLSEAVADIVKKMTAE